VQVEWYQLDFRFFCIVGSGDQLESSLPIKMDTKCSKKRLGPGQASEIGMGACLALMHPNYCCVSCLIFFHWKLIFQFIWISSPKATDNRHRKVTCTITHSITVNFSSFWLALSSDWDRNEQELGRRSIIPSHSEKFAFIRPSSSQSLSWLPLAPTLAIVVANRTLPSRCTVCWLSAN